MLAVVEIWVRKKDVDFFYHSCNFSLNFKLLKKIIEQKKPYAKERTLYDFIYINF